MKIIERIVQSDGAPGKQDLWIDHKTGSPELKEYYNGEWVPIIGGGGSAGSSSGSGCSCDMSNVVTFDDIRPITINADFADFAATPDPNTYICAIADDQAEKHARFIGTILFEHVIFNLTDSTGTLQNDLGETVCYISHDSDVPTDLLLFYPPSSSSVQVSLAYASFNPMKAMYAGSGMTEQEIEDLFLSMGVTPGFVGWFIQYSSYDATII